MMRPLLDYFDVIYDSCTMYESKRFDKLQSIASLFSVGPYVEIWAPVCTFW